MREETEWIELLEFGQNILTGSDKKKILTAFSHIKNMGCLSSSGQTIFGDGNAANKIVKSFL